jgi:DNA (cytosine-5)-methyltransferase 1
LPLRAIDVCAGSGIGSLCFERLGLARTVCYIENERYCQQVLLQRMRDGWLPEAPVWDDLRTFDGRPWRGAVDFVFGGIPCQPWSLAGRQRGSADERDLWPDFLRVVREVRPRVVLVENVPGLLAGDAGRGFGRILGDRAASGYDAEWDVLSAQAVGAPHRRERVWVVAYASRSG